MTYDMVKYERGQVWMIRHKQNTAVGHEQQKDRPWLILSVGKFNKSSKMVTAVPLTSRDRVCSPAQVQFDNDRGMNNVIMCEQIRSFDYSSGAYIFDYMGQLSPEVMEKVDVALSIHLGMHYSPITLNKLYDSMEAIIKSVGHMQSKANTPKFTDDDVLQFAEKLQSLASMSAENEVSAAKEDDEMPFLSADMIPEGDRPHPHQTILDRIDQVFSSQDEETRNPAHDIIKTVPRAPVTNFDPKAPKTILDPVTPGTRAPRIRWTKEKCEEFLNDDKTMPMKQVMKKWNMSEKTRYYSMKNYVQNLLTTRYK